MLGMEQHIEHLMNLNSFGVHVIEVKVSCLLENSVREFEDNRHGECLGDNEIF